MVDDCLITRIGRVEKQAAGVQISMAEGISVRHATICEMPRAGINISEGTWGGHLVEFCDVFDTVLETGDHGSFNSWGRDRYWGLEGAPEDMLSALALLDAVKPTVLRNNRWRCDHGWDVDLDDGSSNYEIYNNLMLRGGLKLREGFHRRVHNNITVNNSLHPHVWYEGSEDVVTGNIFMGAYRPAGGMPKGKWGSEIDRNFFTTSEADRCRFAGNDCDAASLVGDPVFVDATRGDFSVKDGSPARNIGFENFPMYLFGVRKPELRKIARTPAIPEVARSDARTKASPGGRPPPPAYWLGALVRDLVGEEYSAFGVSKEEGGVHLASVPEASPAAGNGFRTGDLLRSVDGQHVRAIADLLRLQDAAAGRPLEVSFLRSQQTHTLKVEAYAFTVAESATGTAFEALPLVRSGDGVSRPIWPILSVNTRPRTVNEPLSTLQDGKLAANYGPIFENGVTEGMYKVDLGTMKDIGSISTWSYGQNGNRGSHRFVLFGSAAARDPGWDVHDAEAFVPLAMVLSRCSGRFHATCVRPSAGRSLGLFRWLVWAVSPVTDNGEHTAFQEFQVLPAK
jgi:hypothetical protein